MADFCTFSALGNRGRLGNQLFQVAATIAYAERTGKIAFFNDWYCDRDHIRYADHFENEIRIANYLPHFHRIFREQGYPYTEIPNLFGNVDLFGYFQSDKHFANCPDLIRHYFTPAKAVESTLRTRWKDALAQPTSSVHVRRGDYLNSPHIYPVATIQYYQRATEYMKKECGVKRFIVFGDDIQWMKSNFRGSDFLFAYKQSPIEDLFLQSFCTHNIITNSSFSWWASWLNKNPNKVVIAPDRWLLNENDRDVYRSEMIVM